MRNPCPGSFLLKTAFPAVFLLTILCSSCGSPGRNPGLAISFDDRFINEWFALRPLLQKYHAKVTFFITCADSLSPDELKKLKILKADGHEIGFHGSIHGKSTELIRALGPEGYIEKELDPGMKYLTAAGFKLKSYAHPGGDHNAKVDSVLSAKGFKITRDVAVSRRKLSGFQLYAVAPRWLGQIFYPNKNKNAVDALLIDTDQNLSEEEMREAIAKAAKTGAVLMLFGHEPLYQKPREGEYGFDVRLLENILKEAGKNKLRFYTMSELPDLAP